MKIFCIGMNKTGTTSLHSAFFYLGYRSIHNRRRASRRIKRAIQKGKPLLTYLNNYDTYTDDPFYRFFVTLDLENPGSKFILNVRKKRSWIKSRIRHCKRKRKPRDIATQKLWVKQRAEHHAKVFEYFADRPDDLLVLNICSGDGWDKLCPFLDKPIPEIPFPWRNKSRRR